MKKVLPLIALLFILIATPVFASSDKNENDDCDENTNHGQYVSCVARQHPGGSAVSSAARSDIGKKEHDDRDENDDEDDDDDGIHASPSPIASPSVNPSPSISPSPSVSPAPSVSPSPDVSPSPEASASPSVSPSPSPTNNQNGILNSIIEKLNEIIESLNNLLK